jgi:hypothetical protein
MYFLQVITTKYGVLYKNKRMLWFYAKQAPTYGVMCYILAPQRSKGWCLEAHHRTMRGGTVVLIYTI